MVKMIRGMAGSAVKGDMVQFPEEVEARLIDLGMAKEVTEEEMSASDISPEPVYLTEKELRKIRSKKDMISYGASIGCELDAEMNLKDMLNAVLNYQEENEIFADLNGAEDNNERKTGLPDGLVNDNFGGPDV